MHAPRMRCQVNVTQLTAAVAESGLVQDWPEGVSLPSPAVTAELKA